MNRTIRTGAALAALLLPCPASAELRQVQINVLEMGTCAYCATSVGTAMKKLDGVESVEVSVEKSSADIRLKAGNKITLAQLRRIIRSHGYPSKDAQITARGAIIDRDGKPVLDLLNGSTLDLAARPKDAPAGPVEITGVSRPGEKDAELLTISTIK